MKLLIPLSYLNEACFLSINIDEKKFKMVLKIAQEELRDVLGAEFYSEIETQYAPSGDTLTSDNSALYEGYIKDFLAWQTYYEYTRFSQFDSTATGLREHSDDNSSIISDIKLHSAEKNILRQSNRYRYNMINFLKLEQDKDSTKYPLYKGKCSDEFSFAISSIERDSDRDTIFSVNKSITTNE
jgi:hypothetical protein